MPSSVLEDAPPDAPPAAGDAASSSNGANKGSDSAKTKKPDRHIDGEFAVKVKSMFVVTERPSCLAPPQEPPKLQDNNNNHYGPNNGNNGNNGNNKSKRSKNNRGQNKKRPRDAKTAYADKACLAVVRGQECPFAKSERGCKYNHDLKEMLANRPPDITEVEGGCPFWNMRGYCDFGLMCRLGSCHVNMSTGQNLCKTVDVKGVKPTTTPTKDNDTKKVEDVAPKNENGEEKKDDPPVDDKPATESNDDAMVEDEAAAKDKEQNGKDATAAEDAPKNPEPNGKEAKDEASKETKPDEKETKDEASKDAKPNEKENSDTKSNDTTSTTFKPVPGAVLGHQSDIKNILSKNTQILLRKNKYPFVCKRHFEVKNQKKNKPPPVQSTNTPALPPKERKLIDFRNKVYIAPLTTVGNLPFRRIMKHYGADITCGEMALADQLLSGKPSEWALLKRHPCEDVFGVQIAAGHADQYTRIAEVLANEESLEIDFVDMNLGCPIDLVCEKGAGASLMLRDKKLRGSVEGMLNVLPCPVTIKMRTGWNEKDPIAHMLVPKIQSWGIDGIGAFMIHGRSRLQRYSRLAKWDYIAKVASSQTPDHAQIPVIGNGDIFSYTDYEEKILSQISKGEEGGDDGGNKNNLLPTAMLGRGALIKPWLPTEIKERRHWDISATERLDMLKDFVKFGLEHWGSDQQGVNRTRRFLLEWLSFLHRYVPVGMLEVLPQQMNHRPPNNMCGRSDLETMMLSKNCADWIKISEMLLGPVPEGFLFEPKHKANSYTKV